MIDINLYRARVGTFNIKKNKQSTSLPTVWKLIHTYLIFCLLMSYSTRYRCVNFYPLNLLIIIITTIKYVYIKDYKTIESYINLKIMSMANGLSFLINMVFYIKIIMILILLCGDIELNPGPTCNFMVAHINARSILLSHTLDDIDNLLLNYYNIDILAVTETHLDHTKSDESININGYNVFRRDRNRMGGGVAIYCKNTIRAKRRFDLGSNHLIL